MFLTLLRAPGVYLRRLSCQLTPLAPRPEGPGKAWMLATPHTPHCLWISTWPSEALAMLEWVGRNETLKNSYLPL